MGVSRSCKFVQIILWNWAVFGCQRKEGFVSYLFDMTVRLVDLTRNHQRDLLLSAIALRCVIRCRVQRYNFVLLCQWFVTPEAFWCAWVRRNRPQASTPFRLCDQMSHVFVYFPSFPKNRTLPKFSVVSCMRHDICSSRYPKQTMHNQCWSRLDFPSHNDWLFWSQW